MPLLASHAVERLSGPAPVLGPALFDVPLVPVLCVLSMCGLTLAIEAGRHYAGTAVAPREVAIRLAILLLLSLLAVGYTGAVLHLCGVDPRPAWEGHGSGLTCLRFGLAQTGWATGETIAYQGCFLLLFLRWMRDWRHGTTLALVASAAVFSFQHVDGAYTTIRYVMVFPFGLLLGLVFLRWGAWWTILLHLVTNLANALVLSTLVIHSN